MPPLTVSRSAWLAAVGLCGQYSNFLRPDLVARHRLLTAEELRPQLAQVREQKEYWEREVDRLRQNLDSIHVAEHNLSCVERFCEVVRHRLTPLSPQQKAELLRQVVERVWVYQDNNLDIEVVVPTFNGSAAPDVI